MSEAFEKEHGYAPGCLGKVYGFQLRYFGGNYGNGIGGEPFTDKDYFVHYERPSPRKGNYYGLGGVDQLAYMMKRIKEDPGCRRIMFSLWNPQDLSQMVLPPCHFCFQVFIDDDGRMTGHLTQRSNDFPVGIPSNICFYSALTHMIAQQTGYQAHEFVHEAVDAHIYEDQIPAVEEYLATPVLPSPTLKLNKAPDIESYKVDDFVLDGYGCGPKIEIPVAV